MGRGRSAQPRLEDIIGVLRPAVVVTYSSDRAQENGMHRLTGEAVEDAARRARRRGGDVLAAAEFYMLATAQQTAEAAQATVPDTAAPLVAYGGQSADALAQRALDTGYASQAVLRPQAAAGCAYRLVTSAVGADTGADLLEHIDVPPAPTAHAGADAGTHAGAGRWSPRRNPRRNRRPRRRGRMRPAARWRALPA